MNFYKEQERKYNELYWNLKSEETLQSKNGFICYPEEVYNIFFELIKTINAETLNILDLGCGNGLLLNHLKERLNKKIIPFGIDFLEKSIHQAKKIFSHCSENFSCGNIVSYDFPISKYEIIIYNPLYLSIEDRLIFTKRLFTHLSEDGIIIIYTYSDELVGFGYKNLSEIFTELKLRINSIEFQFSSLSIIILDSASELS